MQNYKTKKYYQKIDILKISVKFIAHNKKNKATMVKKIQYIPISTKVLCFKFGVNFYK